MKTSIFIKSYFKDEPWLEYLMRSINKFCSGFESVVIVSEDDMSDMVKKHGFVYRKCHRSSIDGYMWQQAIKMCADTFVPEADWIMYVDSDCLFTAPNTPATWMKNDKPYLYMTEYAKLTNQHVWKPFTEKAIGIPWEYDMTHDVMIFAHRHLKSTCDRIRKLHNLGIIEYIIAQTEGRKFSEFNTIGTWARHEFPDDFTLIDKKGKDLPFFPCINHWSWGGLSSEIIEKYENILK